MNNPVDIDIIILSYAKRPELRKLTETALRTLYDSELPKNIRFNTVVIESYKSAEKYDFPNTQTIYPKEKFGYHKYMNIGIEMTQSPFVCICNNDLEFHKGWASEILKAFQEDHELRSASPACSIHHPNHGIALNSGIYYGHEVRKELTGWCLFFKREILAITGKLDPRFKFWFADNDYSMTLQKHGLKHALVTSSIVDHLESQTLNTKRTRERRRLTAKERFFYEYKWEGRSYWSYLWKTKRLK
ncbi:glycosyltransferase [Echinicola marina]|uniref:glycosyltransferase family 2 protein n=1 Tax=Echinicola marina TaxID=2859768 RepID=UPI001CF6661C|nr:glycosyltransferase [Echinicola marina]UCS91820.1 glycosyltransferase [Echinicola marina]